MSVTRRQILARGLLNRCPNCGEHGLFARGLTLHRRCPRCGLELERGEGFFLGSMSINYGMTVLAWLLPVLLLWLSGKLTGWVAAVLAGVGAVAFPVLFYRSSRSWWLMAFFFFLPHELPANRRQFDRGEDDNI
jgi:uncharacterized protein (DUF983 family)